MPRVFIHCGLHKTGTTALQQILLSLSGQLVRVGLLLPKAGRLDHFGGGHHNIAWHLTRDRRYDPRWGTFAALVDEIAAFDGDAVLSSEDFETCLGAPWLFAPLTQHARLRGREFVFIVYVRDQISYAEGLYSQNLGHGAGEDAVAVMREIVERRALAMWEWRYQFDYLAILRRMRAFGAGTMVFRSYNALVGRSIAPDFLAIVSPTTVLQGELGHRTNRRWQLVEALAMFFINRMERKVLTERERVALRLAAGMADGPAPLLGAGIRVTMEKTFGAGNLALCRELGLPSAGLDLASLPAPPPGACLLDRVFSFETQVTLAAIAAALPEPAPKPVDLSPVVRAMLEDMVAEWRRERR